MNAQFLIVMLPWQEDVVSSFNIIVDNHVATAADKGLAQLHR